MSSDFDITGGIAALPIFAAVAAISAAGYLVYKGAQAISRHNEAKRRREEEERRVQEQLRQKQNETYYSSMMDMYESYRTVSSDYERSRQALSTEMEHTLSNLHDSIAESIHSSSAEARRFDEELRREEERVLSEWRARGQALQEDFDRRLQQVFTGISHGIEETGKGLTALKNAGREDQRQEAFANSAIEQAKASLELLRAESEDIPALLSNELDQAISFFNSRDFDIAYSKASGIVTSCMQRIEEARRKKAMYYSMLEQAEARLQEIQERIKASEQVQISWEGNILDEDLSRFEPEMFTGLKNRLAELAGNLEGLKNFSDASLRSLGTLISDLDEVNEDLLSMCKYASAKMVFAYSENNNAEIITTALEEQGFIMLGSAYEGDTEGNTLHINFKHSITGEDLTVELIPNENGVQLSVHNYGTSEGGPGNVRTQQTVQAALENRLGHKGSCRNMGGVSSEHSASDLDSVRRLRVRESQAARRYVSNVIS